LAGKHGAGASGVGTTTNTTTGLTVAQAALAHAPWSSTIFIVQITMMIPGQITMGLCATQHLNLSWLVAVRTYALQAHLRLGVGCRQTTYRFTCQVHCTHITLRFTAQQVVPNCPLEFREIRIGICCP